jgi:cbb3-type cytochrome oxidase subunit 1/mono/diheme cytochrome c family protein
VTAETSSDEQRHTEENVGGAPTARLHIVVAAVFLVIGLIAAAEAALQLAVPAIAGGIEFLSYGLLAPASQVLLTQGWAVLGLLGLSYFALTTITRGEVKRKVLATISLALISIGAASGSIAIVLGLSSGTTGQESPIWARALVAIGVLLATLSITATAKTKGDSLGAAGWYLVAAPILLTLTLITGLIPVPAGFVSVIVESFVNAGTTLFLVTASVGLIYFVFGRISGTTSAQARPVAALGFWSLIVVGAFLNSAELVHSAAPNWLETIAVAFAIAAFVPAIAIATDIGLMLKGSIAQIGDRASLRYATVAAAALATGVAVTFLGTFPATSAVAQFTTWISGLDVLIIAGGASFAIFAGHKVLAGGGRSGSSFHFLTSTLGLILMVAATLGGGVAEGFSWAAGPTSQKFPNWGPGWEVTANTMLPFAWVAAVGLLIFAIAQIVFLFTVGASKDDEIDAPVHGLEYDVEFSGEPKYLTWKRLVGGVTAVWIVAILFTAVLPLADTSGEEPTILADTYRTYEPGTAEFAGRDLYISQGCAQCHTQEVRAVAADVGLGPVSVFGDYANENPVLRGSVRIGPDLFHVATREGFNPDALKAHMRNPQAARPWSVMPSYSYLSDAEIDALVSYIETLR